MRRFLFGTSLFIAFMLHSINADIVRVYVANQSSNNVTVINTADNSFQNIPINNVDAVAPRSITALPDGSRVYVANTSSDNVTVINTADNSFQNIPINALGPIDLTVVVIDQQEETEIQDSNLLRAVSEFSPVKRLKGLLVPKTSISNN